MVCVHFCEKLDFVTGTNLVKDHCHLQELNPCCRPILMNGHYLCEGVLLEGLSLCIRHPPLANGIMFFAYLLVRKYI